MPALYRKYRSGSFAEVIGQPQVTTVLEASLKRGRTAHGYLLVGPHGVGKTSVARILAFSLINEPYKAEKKHIDVIEIDAASNTGVDNIRDLIDKAQIAPSLAKKKVYIIDEVHMLSKSAFNALLKLLEEPPAHVVFILATTEEHKIPATITSRMQRFVFRRIPFDLIASHLEQIAKQEKIKIKQSTLEIIAQASNGSMRDAISLFDQLSSLGDSKTYLDEKLVQEALGVAEQKILKQILKDYVKGDVVKITTSLDELNKKNLSANNIAEQLAHLIQKQINQADKSLINLLQKLIEIPRSPMPELSLTAALYPFHTNNNSNNPKNQEERADKLNKSAASTKEAKTKATKTVELEAKSSTKINFNWNVFVDHVASSIASVASYIKKSDYRLENNCLTIIVHKPFEKKTLDSPSRIKELQAILHKMNCAGLDIHTEINPTATTASKNISDVIKIMGGGEEVELNERI